jgi:hypothetical protein
MVHYEKETEVKNIMNHTLIKEKRIVIVGDSHVKEWLEKFSIICIRTM